VVFAKRPEAGAVKTRMCPPLAPEQAAELYAAMLGDVLETTREAARRANAQAWLAVHPPGAVGAMAATSPPGFAVLAQHGADLAERMAHAAASAAAAGFERILLRGSDSPALPGERLLEGLDALADADLAVGPDRDGGYGWIALRRPVAGLFEHPMSTGSVLEDTLSNARAAGLRVRTLEPHFDLDAAADLAHLADLRREGRADACPRTLAMLDARGLWSHVEAALR
jgi:rSAM/selenodomain-associated transferase 1